MTQQDIHPDPTKTSPGADADEQPLAHQWFGGADEPHQGSAPTTSIPTQSPTGAEQAGPSAPSAPTGEATPAPRTFPSDGFGSPEADQQRTDWYGTPATGGTGLGLAIVAAIVSAHHGTVGVRPTPGGGATFVLELPQHAHSDATASLDDEEVD